MANAKNAIAAFGEALGNQEGLAERAGQWQFGTPAKMFSEGSEEIAGLPAPQRSTLCARMVAVLHASHGIGYGR